MKLSEKFAIVGDLVDQICKSYNGGAGIIFEYERGIHNDCWYFDCADLGCHTFTGFDLFVSFLKDVIIRQDK